MSIFSKAKRTIYIRKIRGFWKEFSQSKAGLLGLALLMVYIIIAIIGPYIVPFDPVRAPPVAAKFAMPEWMTLFPPWKEVPKTQQYFIQDSGSIQNSSLVKLSRREEELILNYSSEGEDATILLYKEFAYLSEPADEFIFTLNYSLQTEDTEYCIELLIKSDRENQLWESAWLNSTYVSLGKKCGFRDRSSANPPWTISPLASNVRKYIYKDWSGRFEQWPPPEGGALSPKWNPTPIILSEKGNLSLLLKISFNSMIMPWEENKTSECVISLNGDFTIWGKAYGLLGTNHNRKDDFTLLICGTRISLLVGVLTAMFTSTIGIFWGVTSGYFGGAADSVMMRLVDILLCIPMLPLLIVLVHMYGKNIMLIILLISVFGWMGLSRTVRSRVLSLREMPFIETAKAAGASDIYLIYRHIVPNVIPIALASVILAVPLGVLAEASLSFLGFGDPMVPTWGRMLYHAHAGGAFTEKAWWDLLPPGLAIAFLCMAFVLMSYSIDQIVNPKLRMRR